MGDITSESLGIAFDLVTDLEVDDWPLIDGWVKFNERIPRVDWNDNPIHHTMFPNDEVKDICIKLESLTLVLKSYAPLKKKNYPVWLWCLAQDNSGWSYTAVCVDNSVNSAILVISEKGQHLGYL